MGTVQNVYDSTMSNVKVLEKMKAGFYKFDAGAAQAVLEVTYPPVIICDPGGGAIDLLLPVEADSADVMFFIINSADAAEVISVKEDSDTTVIVTLAQNEAGWVFCDGTTWYGFVGGVT